MAFLGFGLARDMVLDFPGCRLPKPCTFGAPQHFPLLAREWNGRYCEALANDGRQGAPHLAHNYVQNSWKIYDCRLATDRRPAGERFLTNFLGCHQGVGLFVVTVPRRNAGDRYLRDELVHVRRPVNLGRWGFDNLWQRWLH